ncbi:ATP-binding protein [Effusibacillus consociatus]|uniref:histidine kinase n=1 Tax=Effusibacillus consociatus TaxID=1117041 RepID=A0ABV9Q8W9_9BACL
MILRIAFGFFVVFILISSVLMQKTVSVNLLILLGSCLLLSILFENRIPRIRVLQIALLGIFHWVSHLNWCIDLYLLLTAKTYQTRKVGRTVAVSVFLALLYSSIRLSYSEHTLYTFLVTLFDLLGFVIIVLMVHYFQTAKREKQLLQQENTHLATHDLLTELLNFQEFHKQLQQLLKRKKRVALLLIDCIDLKSMNNEQGFESGDRILKKTAEVLQQIFHDARLLARYGGDKFAVALYAEDTSNQIQNRIELLVNEFPKKLQIEITYGYAVYPDEGESKDELLLLTEERLFTMKREIWLRREEHMLRSEKLRLIGELAAGMAHEIRNPLTTVRGFLQIAKEKNYNIEPWYEVIMGEITRISELTGEFLQFSKPHVSNFKVQPLQECIQRVIDLMKSEAVLLGHQIEHEFELDPIYILMDRDKIVQLLINLIKNAFEAMEENGVVFIRLYRVGSLGTIEIQDTGPGIPQEHLDQIFHPFFTTKKTGTGLGLSICHKIVQDHGGTIDLESSPKGTTFRVTCPAVHGSGM